MKAKKPIFIIEHLEPKLFPWCLIEYESISKMIGRQNLWFTNIKQGKDRRNLSHLGKTYRDKVKDMSLKNVCILDPFAPKTLNPEETKEFDYYIFGGILGNNPMDKRTEKELTRFIKEGEKRNLGFGQFSTDNAVFTVLEIINGKSMEEMKFQEELEIKIDKIQST